MNLVVDAGNTSTKFAVIEGKEIVREWRVDRFSEDDAVAVVAEYAPQRAIISSTCGDEERIGALLDGRIGYVLRMSAQTPVPIGIDYETPATLGTDRVALAVGASRMFDGDDALIFDFGTAITVDLLEDGFFRGGNISLGIGARFRALHDYTAHLPRYEATEVSERFGRSTREAIEQGVMRGVLYEIEGYIGAYLEKNPRIRIIFCGDDAKFFDNRIKNAIFANCYMMYIGLNGILEYNATKECK